MAKMAKLNEEPHIFVSEKVASSFFPEGYAQTHFTIQGVVAYIVGREPKV